MKITWQRAIPVYCILLLILYAISALPANSYSSEYKAPGYTPPSIYNDFSLINNFNQTCGSIQHEYRLGNSKAGLVEGQVCFALTQVNPVLYEINTVKGQIGNYVRSVVI